MRSRILASPRRRTRWAAAGLVAAMWSASFAASANAESQHDSTRVVVANRGSGDISVIDTRTLAVETVDVPREAEPMYVSHDRRNGRVLVGDRANNSVVAFDDESYEVIGAVDVGVGVFHQWVDDRLGQLWVVGDTSDTVTVVDTDSLAAVATIPIPEDLVEQGGFPHDVFVNGRQAFVSILGLESGTGVVVQYSTRTFAETGRIVTGADPHLFVRSSQLYVASQDGSTVARYAARTLRQLGSIVVPNAHGIFVTNRGEVLATNIGGGGTDAVWELNRTLAHAVDVVDTAAPTPHNLTVDDRRQVFVTHSGGAANQVSVIDLDQTGFGGSTLITVGTNPFGLAYVS